MPHVPTNDNSAKEYKYDQANDNQRRSHDRNDKHPRQIRRKHLGPRSVSFEIRQDNGGVNRAGAWERGQRSVQDGSTPLRLNALLHIESSRQRRTARSIVFLPFEADQSVAGSGFPKPAARHEKKTSSGRRRRVPRERGGIPDESSNVAHSPNRPRQQRLNRLEDRDVPTQTDSRLELPIDSKRRYVVIVSAFSQHCESAKDRARPMCSATQANMTPHSISIHHQRRPTAHPKVKA
ncbi:hypothetical protein Pan14r_54830 [Crateriforma conspicua]|uniref:Uncharacterized protein n=1 Tax=Crateriforma conspicua TaxID=2527996 RepID=A0A5C5XRC9_9PLAN|nr:hypothetical protein Pan14r_54830 [Crateriforma conspicua]